MDDKNRSWGQEPIDVISALTLIWMYKHDESKTPEAFAKKFFELRQIFAQPVTYEIIK